MFGVYFFGVCCVS